MSGLLQVNTTAIVTATNTSTQAITTTPRTCVSKNHGEADPCIISSGAKVPENPKKNTLFQLYKYKKIII